MTALAVSSAALVFVAYYLRRTSRAEDVMRQRVSTALNIIAILCVTVYFYLRLTAS